MSNEMITFYPLKIIIIEIDKLTDKVMEHIKVPLDTIVHFKKEEKARINFVSVIALGYEAIQCGRAETGGIHQSLKANS